MTVYIFCIPTEILDVCCPGFLVDTRACQPFKMVLLIIFRENVFLQELKNRIHKGLDIVFNSFYSGGVLGLSFFEELIQFLQIEIMV